ncbi:MAG: BamA/TamA family outer membrane protein [Alcanivoracaceae bacterium]
MNNRGACCRALALLLLLATMTSRAQTCETFFSADDPALYRFVQTRAAIEFDRYAGLQIGEVTVVVLPVFNPDDPKESNWLYRTANFLHIDTRRGTVRRQLTIHDGDTLDPFQIEESERLLRQKNYFADAMIVPEQVCEDRIDLLVVVRDVWTLTPIAAVTREGGENTSDIGFNYDNVLGTGHQLSVAWSSDPERDSVAVAWQATDLFGDHVTLRAAYIDSSDGDVRLVNLVRPFYELDSRWTAGATWWREDRLEEIRLRDVLLNRYGHEIDFDQAFAGWSAGVRDGRVWRWRVGVTDQSDRFYATDLGSVAPEDQRLLYPWLGWESLSDQFWRASNISFSHRQEDIPLGLRLAMTAGVADTRFNSTEDAVLYSVQVSFSRRGGDHHLLQLGTSSSGRWRQHDEQLVSTFVAAEARHFYFISRRDRWFSQLRVEGATGIREDEQFTSGGSDALRGYPLYMQRGDRRWLGSIERRHFTDWHPFRLLRIGGAVYVDAGRTWDSGDAIVQSGATLANIGAGLRISSSKFRVDRVLHLDYAVPLLEREDIDGYQIILSGKVEF